MNRKIKILSIILSCLLVLMGVASCSNNKTTREEIIDMVTETDAPSETTEPDESSESTETEIEPQNENPEETPVIYDTNWEYSSDCTLDQTKTDIVTNAIKKVSGEMISPLAYIGYQEGEDGTNHVFLCGYAVSPAETEMTFSLVYVNVSKSSGNCTIVKKLSLGSLVCDDNKKPESYTVNSGVRSKFSEAFAGYCGVGVQLVCLAQAYIDESGTSHFYLVAKTSPVGPLEMFPSYNQYDPPYSIIHLQVSETGKAVFEWEK